MIIAMIAVGMMQMPSDQVVDVVAVGNRLVAAAGAVNMSRFVAAAVVPRSAGSGIGFADGDRMLGHAAIFLMAKGAIVQVVDVPIVFDLDVPALGTVLVTVFCRCSLLGHDVSFPVRVRVFLDRRRYGYL